MFVVTNLSQCLKEKKSAWNLICWKTNWGTIQYKRPSGNGETHDGTRDDATGVSGCAAPQRWRCPNRLFLGANHETSCPENTCHHRCFSPWGDGHAEGGPRYTCNSTGSGARDTRPFYSVFTYFWICRSDGGKSNFPWFPTRSLISCETREFKVAVKFRRVSVLTRRWFWVLCLFMKTKMRILKKYIPLLHLI